jgi:hypothetical protein
MWSFSLERQQCHKHHQMKWPPLQPWNCPMHFRTQSMRLLSVTLVLHNSKHCANSQIFSAALPPPTANHTHPMYQASSQFRNTFHPAPVPMLGSHIQAPPAPTPPSQSPRIVRYPSQRVSHRQAPSPRVAPRVNPVNVSSTRVNHTLPRHSVLPLTPHPAAANAPYVPQVMTGVNFFDTFEEEHMETPSLPRYNTRAGHTRTMPTTLSIMHHVFSAPLHSQIPKYFM